MTSPLLDELEQWLHRAREMPDTELRDMTLAEVERYQTWLGPYDFILGPFAIRRLNKSLTDPPS